MNHCHCNTYRFHQFILPNVLNSAGFSWRSELSVLEAVSLSRRMSLLPHRGACIFLTVLRSKIPVTGSPTNSWKFLWILTRSVLSQQLTAFKLFLISTRFQGILYCSKMDSSATIIWSLGIFINSTSIPNSIHSHCYFTSFLSNWWTKLENLKKIKYDNCQLAEWVRIWFGFFSHLQWTEKTFIWRDDAHRKVIHITTWSTFQLNSRTQVRFLTRTVELNYRNTTLYKIVVWCEKYQYVKGSIWNKCK